MILRSGTGRATCTRCRGSRAGRARRTCTENRRKKEIEIVIEFGMRDKDFSCSFPPFHPSSLFRPISALKTSPSGSSSSLGGGRRRGRSLESPPLPSFPLLSFSKGEKIPAVRFGSFVCPRLLGWIYGRKRRGGGAKRERKRKGGTHHFRSVDGLRPQREGKGGGPLSSAGRSFLCVFLATWSLIFADSTFTKNSSNCGPFRAPSKGGKQLFSVALSLRRKESVCLGNCSLCLPR